MELPYDPAIPLLEIYLKISLILNSFSVEKNVFRISKYLFRNETFLSIIFNLFA